VAKIARNFTCDFTGLACEDPHCRIGFCILEKGIITARTRPDPVKDARVRKSQRPLIVEATRFAKEILKGKKLQPTKARLEMLIKRPSVLAEAQRRLEFHESILDKIKSVDDFFCED
jgi:hypothetical protein